MNIAPNFIGGYEGRQAYLNGDRCFNDANAVAAFQEIADIAPFFPDGQQALTYYDSQQLFLQGQAAMWLGGSWDIPFFEKEAPDFNISGGFGDSCSLPPLPSSWDAIDALLTRN